MKVKELLLTASLLAGKEDLNKKLSADEVTADDADVKKLIAALNLITEELAEWTVTPEKQENLASGNGKYYYTSFSSSPLKIKKVEYEGAEIPFKTYSDRIEAKAEKITVTYSYLFPKITALTDDAKVCDLLGERAVAYGIAAEYLLIAGLFGEAVTLRDRFEEGVSSYLTSRKTPKIRKRSWL